MQNHTQHLAMIDTHCHLDSSDFTQDLDCVIESARAKNVAQIIIPAADMRTLSRAQEIASKYENIYFATGAHPYDLEYFDKELLHSSAQHPKCVAIGECGLDYYRLPEDSEEIPAFKARQKEAFIAQIELALELGLPLIVHIREATNDAFEILKPYAEKGLKGVLHCFNADRILLNLSENFYYGIGGVSTFKNARRLIEVLALIPKNRILFETDAPYLTPHPFRGTRNEPSYIPLIAQKISEVLEIPLDSLQKQVLQNTYRLFGKLQPLKDYLNNAQDFEVLTESSANLAGAL